MDGEVNSDDEAAIPTGLSDEAQRMAQLYHQIFEIDQRGAAVLEDLMNRFKSQTPAVEGGIDAVLTTYRNAGRTEVIDFVIRRINQGRER